MKYLYFTNQLFCFNAEWNGLKWSGTLEDKCIYCTTVVQIGRLMPLYVRDINPQVCEAAAGNLFS